MGTNGGGLELAAAAGAAPLAFPAAVPLAVDEDSPLALVMDDCAEAGALHTRKQKIMRKRIVMGRSTTLQFRGEEARGWSKRLAGKLVVRQKHPRQITHRVAQALCVPRHR
jgi:hypothetical protein